MIQYVGLERKKTEIKNNDNNNQFNWMVMKINIQS